MATRTKLKHLLQDWAPGGVMTTPGLFERGISSELAAWYVSADWLRSIGEGAYHKVGDRPVWQGAISALQFQLELPLHLGGETRFHFESEFKSASTISEKLSLFGASRTRLPKWFREFNWGPEVSLQTPSLFEGDPQFGVEETKWGGHRVKISTMERAIFELLYPVKDAELFFDVDRTFPRSAEMDSDKLNRLLQSCTSRRVKRLFLCLAEKYEVSWFGALKLGRVDLGSGPLSIAKGGKYISKWQIQIPEPLLG